MSIKNLSEYPDLLTVQEACEILRVGRRTVYKYINDLSLRSRMIAGKYRIPKASVVNFIDEICKEVCYNDDGDGSDTLHQDQ